MNQNWTRGALAALALGITVAGCSKGTDQTETSSQGGMTAKARAPGHGLFSRHSLLLPVGTAVAATNVQTISSRSSRVGSRVTARVNQTIVSSTGDTMIPAGAEFIGHVTAIHTPPRPDATGTLQLSFDSLRIGGKVLPVATRITAISTTIQGRGVTATDAAKVGAGAVIGGIAGQIIGHNAQGTIIGAAAGGAAGAVVAHSTRTVDIVLPQGGAIRLELTEPFDRNGRVVAQRP